MKPQIRIVNKRIRYSVSKAFTQGPDVTIKIENMVDMYGTDHTELYAKEAKELAKIFGNSMPRGLFEMLVQEMKEYL